MRRAWLAAFLMLIPFAAANSPWEWHQDFHETDATFDPETRLVNMTVTFRPSNFSSERNISVAASSDLGIAFSVTPDGFVSSRDEPIDFSITGVVPDDVLWGAYSFRVEVLAQEPNGGAPGTTYPVARLDPAYFDIAPPEGSNETVRPLEIIAEPNAQGELPVTIYIYNPSYVTRTYVVRGPEYLGYTPFEVPAESVSVWGTALRSRWQPQSLIVDAGAGRTTEVVVRHAGNPAPSASSPPGAEPTPSPSDLQPFDPVSKGQTLDGKGVSTPATFETTNRALATVAIAAGSIALCFVAVVRRWPLLGIALYSRLRRSTLLDAPVRDGILQVVRETPGVSASSVGRRLGLSHGQLDHHLKLLRKHGIVIARREGREIRLFAAGATMLPSDAAHERIRSFVGERPATITAIAEQLGCSKQTVHYHVRRMHAAGLVNVLLEGGRILVARA